MTRFIFIAILVLLTSCSKHLFEPGRALLVNGGDNTIQIIDIRTFKEVKTKQIKAEPGYFAHHADVSSGKGYVAVAFPDYDFSQGHEGLHNVTKPGKILVLNARNLKEKRWIDVPKANYNAVFNVQETEIWSAGYSHSGRVYVYDVSSGTLKKEIIVESDPSNLLFDNEGKYVAVACGESSFVTLIDPQTLKKVRDIKVDPYPSHVRNGSAGKILVENKLKKSLNILDIEKLKAIDFIDLEYSPLFSKYNSKTGEIWVVPEDTPEIHIYQKTEKGKWEIRDRLATDFPLSEFDFYGNMLLGISTQDNALIKYNINTKRTEKKFTTGSRPNALVLFNAADN